MRLWLHVLESGNYHIGAIENSHISGRTTNSPITDFALKLMSSKAHEREDFVVNYKAETINGKTLKGSTFFIKDEEGNLKDYFVSTKTLVNTKTCLKKY